MKAQEAPRAVDLAQRLAEAEATIAALLSGQIDAVVDPRSQTPVLLSKAQDALRESEERYRRIVETSNEGIWTVDGDAKITFVNRRIGEILGYQAGEMLGRSWFEFLPEASRARAELRIARARQGVSDEDEIDVTRKDGSLVWALLKTSPIRGADGHYVGVLAMLTDRTRYRVAEEAARKIEEQYRQIVETTSDGIVKSDCDARIVFANRRFAEMLGYAPHEMIGTTLFTYMTAAAKMLETERWIRPYRGLKDTLDTTFCHKDGTEISVSIAGTSLVDKDGGYAGNLGVVRDITERKKLQSQLMVSDRMASVGTLAAGVAHEINNPLAAVMANLDYIAELLARTAGGDSSALKPPLDDARDAAQRVRFIVRDLKIFSRSPSEKPSGPVDVNAIMESALRMAWNEIRHRAHLVKHYGSLPGIQVNEARLGQVFLNLVVNAAQALPEGRAAHNEIRVTTRVVDDRAVIEVSDTGAGIRPEIIGRIFDAFFTTKEVGVGTGLGLAICQRIVTDMGGELTVVSAVGEGTTFRVALPVTRLVECAAIAAVERAPINSRRGRILLVDDEELIVRSVARILSHEHEVVAVISAKEALARCAGGESFDLILCDLMMPDMTGMDLHRELLRIAPDQADRMIFLTGGAFTETARRFLSDAPKEHLEKPFDPANLRAIVQRHLRCNA